MVIRILFLLLLGASLALRASDAISASYSGASATVTQPHVTAELIPETRTVEIGKSFDVILHLHSDPGWHTYWINPGDAGLATSIKWTLPDGFTAGPIQWPTPEKHKMGPLVTYGYEGDVYLLTTITFPKEFTGKFQIKAKASWLVCQEECIPGRAELELSLERPDGPFGGKAGQNTAIFDAARARLPVPNTKWEIRSGYKLSSSPPYLVINFTLKDGTREAIPSEAYFFPQQANVLSCADSDNPSAEVVGQHWDDGKAGAFKMEINLQQNGEKPDKLSGVLVSDVPLIGNAKAVYISEFPVTSVVAAATGGSPSTSTPQSGTDDGHRPPLQGKTAPPLGAGAPVAAATSEAEAAGTHRSPEQGEGGMMASSAAKEAQPWLIAVLGAAFVGGLILNLMPCVLPVLSLKVFSLMKHAGDDPRGAWKQGAAFTAGVVLSFWLLAGLLLFLRAAGNQLGWGFQMQSPGFVLALIFIFFLLALNLFGVFELGTSLVGLDAKVTGQSHGLTSSFLNGALATLAATPCTAPFMGSALGFAAQQSAAVSLLIFTFLAMGMATPYLLLTIFPGALKFVPKPGAWMEAFKQFMGFLLMATVIFLLYVFGALVGEAMIFQVLLTLLLASLAAWIYGRWQNPSSSVGGRRVATAGAFLILILSFGLAADAAMGPIRSDGSDKRTADGYQPWSQDAVQQALAEGKPVFVDFTAAWCLSCKVNERVALDVDSVRKAFADKNVVLFKADWTHADPEISKALQKYNRDGVPLYLLYSPKDPTKPQVLPEVLTPGIVLEALGKV